MDEVERGSYKDGYQSQVVQNLKDEDFVKSIFEKPLKDFFLPLKFEYLSLSTGIECYQGRIAHCMKVSGGENYYCFRKNVLHIGVTHIDHKESVVVVKGMKSLILSHFQLQNLGI